MSRQLTLHEKWAIDAETYKNSNAILTKTPQCETCAYRIKEKAFNCQKYCSEEKPKEVVFCDKECIYFSNVEQFHISDDVSKFSRIYGGIIGFCVGDMLGVPVEFSGRDERESDPVNELRAYGTYHQPFGTWSDDTSLMLCLLDSLCEECFEDKLKNNMLAFLNNGLFTPGGTVFDIGISTREAIIKMGSGITPEKCGGMKISDNGNGALMRILPFSFLVSKRDSEELVQTVCKISSYTHGHIISKFACVFYVALASYLYSGYKPKDSYDNTIRFIRQYWKEEIPNQYNDLMNEKILSYSVDSIRSTPFVVDTLEAVIWCLFDTQSYKECVLKAVNLGGDTDTIAALSGGLAGIYYGFQDIPENWIQNIRNIQLIEETTHRFIGYNKL